MALGTTGTGAYFANTAPVVQGVPVTLRGLDPALDGFRIVTSSDGHLSPTYGGRRFARLVELVNAQRPDVVAIVGDLVDGEVDELRDDVVPLADLVSTGTAVPGRPHGRRSPGPPARPGDDALGLLRREADGGEVDVEMTVPASTR